VVVYWKRGFGIDERLCLLVIEKLTELTIGKCQTEGEVDGITTV